MVHPIPEATVHAVRILQSAAAGLAVLLAACGGGSDPTPGSGTPTGSSTVAATSPPTATRETDSSPAPTATQTVASGSASAASTPAPGASPVAAPATGFDGSIYYVATSTTGSRRELKVVTGHGAIRTVPVALSGGEQVSGTGPAGELLIWTGRTLDAVDTVSGERAPFLEWPRSGFGNVAARVAWSSNGRLLALMPSGVSSTKVFPVDAAGAVAWDPVLTVGETDVLSPPNAFLHSWSFAFSADGESLLIAATERRPDRTSGASGLLLYRIADGAMIANLTPEQRCPATNAAMPNSAPRDPDWSIASDRILYLETMSCAAPSPLVHLWVMSADGSDQHDLTEFIPQPTSPTASAVSIWSARWSPDGAEIAVATTNGIFIMSADGSDVRHFPDAQLAPQHQNFAWLPE